MVQKLLMKENTEFRKIVFIEMCGYWQKIRGVGGTNCACNSCQHYNS